MTPSALVFMLLSWGLVLSLMGWSFARILKPPRPAPPEAEDRARGDRRG